jgi:hypothetical protein
LRRLQSSHARVTWTRFSFFATAAPLPQGYRLGSGGGTRTRDNTIMSRVL